MPNRIDVVLNLLPPHYIKKTWILISLAELMRRTTKGELSIAEVDAGVVTEFAFTAEIKVESATGSRRDFEIGVVFIDGGGSVIRTGVALTTANGGNIGTGVEFTAGSGVKLRAATGAILKKDS